MKKVQCIECHGQAIPEGRQCRTCGGRGYIIVDDAPKEKSLAIVAMGTSSLDYTLGAMPFGGLDVSETWAINFAAGVIQCDACIMMDDLWESLERSKEVPLAVKFHYDLMRAKFPIITTQHYPEWPTSVPYPLPQVINEVGVPYMNNTVAYAVALAIYLKFEKIMLYGADFTYPNSHVGEKGRGNVEFYLGMAKERGIKVMIARNSNMMDTNIPIPQRLYGYKEPPNVVGVGDNGKRVWQWHDERKFKRFDDLKEVLAKPKPNPILYRKFGSVENVAHQAKQELKYRKFDNVLG